MIEGWVEKGGFFHGAQPDLKTDMLSFSRQKLNFLLHFRFKTCPEWVQTTLEKMIFLSLKTIKNDQNFTFSDDPWNALFEVSWPPCKKPHVSRWSRTRVTIVPTILFRPVKKLRRRTVCVFSVILCLFPSSGNYCRFLEMNGNDTWHSNWHNILT